MNAWHNVWTITKRELGAYFTAPLAYVFIVIFLLLCGFFTFFVGGFFERQEASLVRPFFDWHPWFYLFLVPAVGMRLWAEERRVGTIELLLTMPITAWQAIVGKFLASWLFLALALALTFPVVLTVNYLGDPDNGVILTAYIGSWLMAGAYLAISCITSALTRSQVVSFIISLVVCLLLQPLLLEPAEQGQPSDNKERNDKPMADTQNLGQGDLAKIPPGQGRGLHGRIGLGIEGRPAEHADDSPNGIPAPLAHRAQRGAGAVAQEPPADTENQTTGDHPTEYHRLDGQFCKPQVAEKVNADHAHEHGGEHELYYGHVNQAQGAQLSVVAKHPPFLQQEAEQNAGNQSVHEGCHLRSPPP